MQFFAHSKRNEGGSPAPKAKWESLFKPEKKAAPSGGFKKALFIIRCWLPNS
jgi:hypothetical protein